MFTPHARGSTACEDFERRTSMVYPACAGIDPIDKIEKALLPLATYARCFSDEMDGTPLPHADRPLTCFLPPENRFFARGSTVPGLVKNRESSVYPHADRPTCFAVLPTQVYPACADRTRDLRRTESISLPHARISSVFRQFKLLLPACGSTLDLDDHVYL